jgi:hypothetical protein
VRLACLGHCVRPPAAGIPVEQVLGMVQAAASVHLPPPEPALPGSAPGTAAVSLAGAAGGEGEGGAAGEGEEEGGEFDGAEFDGEEGLEGLEGLEELEEGGPEPMEAEGEGAPGGDHQQQQQQREGSGAGGGECSPAGGPLRQVGACSREGVCECGS